MRGFVKNSARTTQLPTIWRRTGPSGRNTATPVIPNLPQTNIKGWWMATQAYDAINGGGNLITTDASAVASLKDMSGNSFHLNQATAGNKWSYANNKINGLPSIYNTSTDRWMKTPTGWGYTGSCTFIGVFKPTNYHTDGWPYITIYPETLVSYLEQYGDSPAAILYGGAGKTLSTSQITLNSYHLVFCQWAGATSYLCIDGNAATSANMNEFSAADAFAIGYPTGGYCPQWELAEAAIWTAVLLPTSGDGLTARVYFDRRFNLGLGLTL